MLKYMYFEIPFHTTQIAKPNPYFTIASLLPCSSHARYVPVILLNVVLRLYAIAIMVFVF